MKGFIAKTIVAFFVCMSVIPQIAIAHCDTLDGPVVKDARVAFEKGDVTPVLKWIRKEDETEIRNLFKKTSAVRSKGPEAKELADMYFFETLVRVHRAAEGAPYTGLKPAGEVETSVAEADKALESGSVEDLVKMVAEAAAEGIKERFAHVKEAKKHADETVEEGREFVKAYVEFTHYAERLHLDATAPKEHLPEIPEAERHHHH